MFLDGKQRLVRRIGVALSLLGIVFVGRALVINAQQIPWAFFRGAGVVALVLGVALGLVSGLALGGAWWLLLKHLGASLSPAWAISTFSRCQLARYIPGHIFHYVGRQTAGMQEGVDSAVLVRSSVLELISLVAASVPFGALWFFAHGACDSLSLPAIGGGCVLLGLIWLLRAERPWPFVGAWALHLCYFVAGGLTFALLVATAQGGFAALRFEDFAAYLGACAIAWLGGLVTPGAPAGLGVREGILYGLLNGLVPSTDLLAAILLSRVASIAGDVIFGGVAFVYRILF